MVLQTVFGGVVMGVCIAGGIGIRGSLPGLKDAILGIDYETNKKSRHMLIRSDPVARSFYKKNGIAPPPADRKLPAWL